MALNKLIVSKQFACFCHECKEKICLISLSVVYFVLVLLMKISELIHHCDNLEFCAVCYAVVFIKSIELLTITYPSTEFGNIFSVRSP